LGFLVAVGEQNPRWGVKIANKFEKNKFICIQNKSFLSPKFDKDENFNN